MSKIKVPSRVIARIDFSVKENYHDGYCSDCDNVEDLKEIKHGPYHIFIRSGEIRYRKDNVLHEKEFQSLNPENEITENDIKQYLNEKIMSHDVIDQQYSKGLNQKECPYGSGSGYCHTSVLRNSGIDYKHSELMNVSFKKYPHGNGKLYDENGVLQYEGDFEDGTGYGKSYSDGKLLSEGSFENGYTKVINKMYNDGILIMENDNNVCKFYNNDGTFNLEVDYNEKFKILRENDCKTMEESLQNCFEIVSSIKEKVKECHLKLDKRSHRSKKESKFKFRFWN
jgi:hypothetical protein